MADKYRGRGSQYLKGLGRSRLYPVDGGPSFVINGYLY